MAKYQKVSATPTADVATNGTITFGYPSGQSASTVAATGAKAFANGLGNMLAQAAGGFSIAYSTGITLTYLGTTSIPKGTVVDLFVPVASYGVPNNDPYQFDVQAAITQTTDNSGGTASDTVAAISDAATKNAVASIVAKLNTVQTVLKNAGLTS